LGVVTTWINDFDYRPGELSMIESLAILGVMIAVATSLTLLLNLSWRWNMIALALQYAASFWLVALVYPIGLAAVKLVAGWMAVALVAASQMSGEVRESEESGSEGHVFRILAAVLIWLSVISITPIMGLYLPSRPEALWGGLILLGMGLLQLGMIRHPTRSIFGLFTFLSGFDILYSLVESSILVTGLLAVVTLGIALVTIYVASPLSEAKE